MNTPKTESPDAVAGPVERQVRPRSLTFAQWADSLTVEDRYDFDSEGRGFKKDPGRMMRLAWDAAVAAERERWEAVVFDGWRVLKGLDERAQKRTSHQNVSDTLDALMRVLRA